jgi:hypothetical protein
MPPSGFELTIPASERPQTHALDRAATGIDYEMFAGMENRATAAELHTCLQLRTSPLRILYHQPEDDTLRSKHLATLTFIVRHLNPVFVLTVRSFLRDAPLNAQYTC